MRPYVRHPRRPPEVDALLAELDAHGVDFVVTGSVAVKLHGVALTPGDLDVVPALTPANLERLFRALDALEATPDGFGRWQVDGRGERRWLAEEATEARLRAWSPAVDDRASYDHLFRTRLGDLDVVPELNGSYDHLARRAVTVRVSAPAGGRRVRIAHVDDLLATMTVPRRERDVDKVRGLRLVQRGRSDAS